MLKDSKAFSSFSVNDIDKARSFYGETLGLNVEEQDMESFRMLRLLLKGGGEVLLYPKPDHQPASHTVLNFPVDDLDKVVDYLTSAGVRFETDMGAINTDDRGISTDPGPRVAWFKDPFGNTLAVMDVPNI